MFIRAKTFPRASWEAVEDALQEGASYIVLLRREKNNIRYIKKSKIGVKKVRKKDVKAVFRHF